MQTVATFAQLADTPIDLRIGGDIDHTFTQNIPGPPASGEGSFLAWNVRREGSGSVTYEVKVNGTSIATYTVTQMDWSTVQETMPTDVVHQGNNTVEFRVTAGTAILSFSDVLLWYRVQV